jgi:hypothetical protein
MRVTGMLLELLMTHEGNTHVIGVTHASLELVKPVNGVTHGNQYVLLTWEV